MDEEIRTALKPMSPIQMTEIWLKAKDRDFDDLDDEKQRIARIMVEHEEELFDQFENAHLTYDPDRNPDTEYDPFLHITIHSIVEAQLELGDPIEVVEFFNAMRQKKYHRHDAIHLVGQILTYLIFEMSEYQKPFDLATYRKLLGKYKSRNPEELVDSLENEPLLSDPE
ncbi:MAG: DUF1841 family protein [Desulfobacteraceae bacterium]|jgi:hypothetical protein|nr:DUF1841 family protein [Desulfobacteraceae bacterium]